MKKLLIVTIMFVINQSVIAQLFGEPNLNNFKRACKIRTNFGMYGDSFYNQYSGETINTSTSTNLWISAKSEDNELLLSANYTVQTNKFEHAEGPLKEDGEKFEEHGSIFGRTWKVYGHEVKTVKDAFEAGSLEVTSIPKDLKEWPAIGNPFFNLSNGEKLNQALAPFYDENNDGFYNPLDGDLPLHNEDLQINSRDDFWSPFQMNFVVYNDNRTHQVSRGKEIKVEIQVLTYVLNCDQSDDLQNTIFSRYKITNKSGNTLYDLKLGVCDDGFINSPNSTYHGVHKESNTVYFYYNQKEEPFNPFQVEEGILRNLVFLNKELKGSLSYYNQSVGLPIPHTVYPSKAEDFDNYLSLKWLDGTPLTMGGIGYDSTNIEETNFLFTDFPNDPEGWSMLNESFILSTRNLAILDLTEDEVTLDNFESIKFELGTQIILQPDNPGLAIFDVFEDEVQSLRDSYAEMNSTSSNIYNCFNSLTSTKVEPHNEEIKLFPNPASSILYIEKENNELKNLKIFDLHGRMIQSMVLISKLTEIDISLLSNGIFYVTIENQFGELIKRKKVIIAN